MLMYITHRCGQVKNMIKLSFQNGNFNLSAPYVDSMEALEHQRTTYSFYVSIELIVTFEPFLKVLTPRYGNKFAYFLYLSFAG